EDAFVSRQPLSDDVGLPSLGHAEDDVLAVREDPHVVVYPPDADFGFINVDEWAFEDGLKESGLGCGIVSSHPFQEIDVGHCGQSNPEKMLRHLRNDAVG